MTKTEYDYVVTNIKLVPQNIESYNHMRPSEIDSTTDWNGIFTGTREVSAITVSSNEAHSTVADNTGSQESPAIPTIPLSTNKTYSVVANNIGRTGPHAITVNTNEAYGVVADHTGTRESPTMTISSNEAYSTVAEESGEHDYACIIISKIVSSTCEYNNHYSFTEVM